MQRLIARLLLLLTAVGILLPPVLQASGASIPFCCRRSGQHHCQSSAALDPQQTAVHAHGCSQHSRCAMATLQWAYPEPLRTGLPAHEVTFYEAATPSGLVLSRISCSQFARAPPA